MEPKKESDAMQSSVKGFNRLKWTLAVIVLAVIALMVWYAYNRSPGPSKGSLQSAASGWQTYESKQYGFQFNYPKDWGVPKLSASGSPAKHFSLIFGYMAGAAKASVVFDSDEPVKSQCAPNDKNCASVTILNRKSIESRLSQDKKNFIKYDKSSFATLVSSPGTGISDALSISQEVNLSKVNVTAVLGQYYILGSSKCPSGHFSSDKGCVSEANYEDFNKVIKSFKEL